AASGTARECALGFSASVVERRYNGMPRGGSGRAGRPSRLAADRHVSVEVTSMKIVLAFEGMDGSGKTSLAVFTRKLCEQHNQRYTLLGRREAYASPLVGRLTGLLHEEAANLVPQADIAVRLAREYQRAALAAAAPSGVVVLDRFVLSLLSLARFHGL